MPKDSWLKSELKKLLVCVFWALATMAIFVLIILMGIFIGYYPIIGAFIVLVILARCVYEIVESFK